MAEHSAFDPNNAHFQPLGPPPGLLEQFNLPPKLIAFIRKNQRSVWVVISLCFAVAIGFAAFTSYQDYRAAKATSALDGALRAKKDAKLLLEKVAQEFASTPSGVWAKSELALLAAKEGQRPQAIAQFEAIKSTLSARSLLKPLVLVKLGGLYETEGQFDKALSVYTELATQEGFAADAYRSMGRVYEQLKKKAEARTMYEKYLELSASPDGQKNSDPVRELVQSRLNQLKN